MAVVAGSLLPSRSGPATAAAAAAHVHQSLAVTVQKIFAVCIPTCSLYESHGILPLGQL